jgi:adenylate cyclase
MADERAARTLLAVLVADVARYSLLVAADDEGTLARLNAHRRSLIDPAVKRHRGRLVKTTGDGFLLAFASAVDAVRCAVEMQSGMAQRNVELAPDSRMDFRVGINVGDMVEEDGDLFGDAVNVAARLEAIAEPGGICISERVREDVIGKIIARCSSSDLI